MVKLHHGQGCPRVGQRQIGATNVLRTTGKARGVATLVLDIAKGFAAVWIAAGLTDDNSPLWTSLAALAVMAGHSYPGVSAVPRAERRWRALSERFCI